MKLCGMSKQLRAAFELVRLHQAFDVRSRAAEAVIYLMLSPLKDLSMRDSMGRSEVVSRRCRAVTSGNLRTPAHS